jgi:hypothetical protein
MVYNTQNYWVSGLCPSSGILNARKHISETGSVSVLRSEPPIVLYFPSMYASPFPHLRTETDPVSEALCFLVFRIPRNGSSPETQ